MKNTKIIIIKEIRKELSKTQESLIDEALENGTEVYSRNWNKLEDVLVLLDDLEEALGGNDE